MLNCNFAYPGTAEEVLQAHTAEDLRAKTEREAAALAAERATEVPEAPPAETFVLTGSNRPADVAEAHGQASLI